MDIHIISVGGCYYYVLCIDDFSRFTWMYPMHFKSELKNINLFFKNLFFCSIQQLQYDNDGEYLSKYF
jgi:hypothetical protein